MLSRHVGYKSLVPSQRPADGHGVVPSRTPLMVVAAPPQGRGEQLDLGGGFVEFCSAIAGLRPAGWQPPSPRSGTAPILRHQYAPKDRCIPGTRARSTPIYLRRSRHHGSEAPGNRRDRYAAALLLPGRARRPGAAGIMCRLPASRPAFCVGEARMARLASARVMLKRQPWLPHFVAGGPNNPLVRTRDLYLGSTLYPWLE